jgi:NAD(P)-dependent dehydrogenase (short-subunit alcohol dehydrogenase family)
MSEIAVVTGSASGIGQAVRDQLEADGLRVVGVDLRDAEVIADVSTPEGRSQAVAGAREAAGAGIQKLVVAAGVGGHIERADLVPKVNYFGALAVLDGLADAMKGQPGASAVVVASNSAQLPGIVSETHPFVLALLEGDESRALAELPEAGAPLAYPMSKHALARAVRRRAAEWGSFGVRLNAIAPGTTETPLLRGSADHPVRGQFVDSIPVPLGRRAQPHEIARVIRFLLCDDASYIHGSVVWADGGTDAVQRPDAF